MQRRSKGTHLIVINPAMQYRTDLDITSVKSVNRKTVKGQEKVSLKYILITLRIFCFIYLHATPVAVVMIMCITVILPFS